MIKGNVSGTGVASVTSTLRDLGYAVTNWRRQLGFLHRPVYASRTMWNRVPADSCVQEWFDLLKGLGADVQYLEGTECYVVWCLDDQEFHALNVSDAIAEDCSGMSNRFKSMKSLEGALS